MFVETLEWLGVGIILLAFVLAVLLTVGAVGFVLVVLYAIFAGLLQEALHFYREHFGPSAELRRTREALDEEEREYFNEAMERLKIEGVDHMEESEDGAGGNKESPGDWEEKERRKPPTRARRDKRSDRREGGYN